MPAIIHSYTIYHSPNAHLGSTLLRRVAAGRTPAIFVPRERGVLVAEMLGGKDNANAGSTTARIARAGHAATRSP